MLTKEDLQAIGELFVAEREHTKKLLDANNSILGTIVRAELSELKQGQKRIEQKLDRVAKDHEERIEIIEEHVGLPHKN